MSALTAVRTGTATRGRPSSPDHAGTVRGRHGTLRRPDATVAERDGARPRRSPWRGAPILGTAAWTSPWGEVHLAVTDVDVLLAARALVRRELAAVERAARRSRADAEVHRLYRAAGRPVRVSQVLADVVAAALAAADLTEGAVDPTVGPLTGPPLGTVPPRPRCGGAAPRHRRAAVGASAVTLEGRRLRVPAGVTLDLSVIAPARAADRAAALVPARFGTGVLVAIGADVATAGPAPDGGWAVPTHAAGTGAIRRLPTQAALSTCGPGLLDPRTGAVAPPLWSAVTVQAPTCVEAAALAAAAVVRGPEAPAWLAGLDLPAHLDRLDGTGTVDLPGRTPR